MADTINLESGKSTPVSRNRKRDKVGGNKGGAVMVLIMGAMLVGGLVVWAVTGKFHMMPMIDGHGYAKAKTEVTAPETRAGTTSEQGHSMNEDTHMNDR